MSMEAVMVWNAPVEGLDEVSAELGRGANRASLRLGVEHIRCTDSRPARSLPSTEYELLKAVLPEGHRLSSCEVYESGAMNAFVRSPKNELVGFIRVRNEREATNNERED